MSPVDASNIADEEVRADAADVGDEEAAVCLWRDVRGSVVGELAVPVGPPFGQRVLSGWYFGGLPPGFRVDIVVINAVASRQGGQLKVGLLRDLITFCCDKCPPIKTFHITYILTIDMQMTAQYVKNISL